MSENQIEMEDVLDTEGITSTEVLTRVNALIKLQEEQTLLSEEMEKEILAIEKKYLAKFQPLAEKRSEIVTGKSEPTAADVAKEPITVEGLTSKPEEKGIPNFWAHVLGNTEFKGIIEEVDKEPLSFLSDIKITQVGDEQDFSIDFVFAENPFFSNTIISKTVHIKDDDLEGIESTPINWKDGKNFSVKMVKKSVKAKGKGKASTAATKMVEEPIECFFSSFLSGFDMDSDEGQEAMYLQYQLVLKLKEVVIPNAVDFFLGRADDNDGEGFGDYDFEGEDYDDEEGEEGDDDENDEPVIRTRGAKGGKPVAPTDPNCKQQ